MAQWALFWGCMLTAFAPVSFLFFTVVAQRAQLVILTITAAFFYLVSLLVAATLWQVIPPLHDSIHATIPVSILIQEVFRYAFFQVYVRCEQAVKRVTTKQNQLPLNDLTSSFASGVGFALMRSLMMYGTVLAASMTGEGAAFTSTCPQMPLVFASALSTLALTLMDVALMVLAFEGFRKRSLAHIMAVVLLHLGSGLSNMLNLNEVGCKASIPLTYVAAVLAIAAATISVKRTSSTYA
ncbi:Aste57867_25071 [Aphanomyces stellatus]|uniref:Aste57867_25071 protein n=1 Tax=Aphanomyces stellatus TaxID=120398 RepID=A0A485LS72_9STRA